MRYFAPGVLNDSPEKKLRLNAIQKNIRSLKEKGTKFIILLNHADYYNKNQQEICIDNAWKEIGEIDKEDMICWESYNDSKPKVISQEIGIQVKEVFRRIYEKLTFFPSNLNTQDPVPFKIISGIYTDLNETVKKDVTQILISKIRNDTLTFHSQYYNQLFGDPIRLPKKLKITFEINGIYVNTLEFKENENFSLPGLFTTDYILNQLWS